MRITKLTFALLTLVGLVFATSYFGGQTSSAAPIFDRPVNAHWKGASSLTPVGAGPNPARCGPFPENVEVMHDEAALVKIPPPVSMPEPSDHSGNMSFWRVAIDEETGKVLGEAEAVATPSNFNRHLSFSSNGRRMIYVQTNQQSNIQAIKFDPQAEKISGEPFWITRGDRHIVRPELSPDGTRFVMRISRRTQDDIVVVSRDGTQWRDLTNDKAFDRYPRWSPDGKRIAFTSDRCGQYEIWVLDADATNFQQLTFDSQGDTTFPIWSPDGLSGPPSVVASFSFETNSYEKLTDFGSSAMWLPDSTRFVFFFNNKLYLCDIKTKRVREVFASNDNQIRNVDISPDGKLIYYSVYRSESDIWLLDLE